MKPKTIEEYVAKYPCITAAIIAHSLGYATPHCAGAILKDAKEGEENWCEWIYSCYNRSPLPAVQDAIHRRHSLKGYMADYQYALAIVRRYNATGHEPLFASWF